MSNLPPTLDTLEFAKMLHMSVRLFQRKRKRQRYAFPPARIIGDKWIWDTTEVLKWLATPNPIASSTSLQQQLLQTGEAGKELDSDE